MARSSRSSHTAHSFDVAAFCRGSNELQGRFSLAELPRVADSVLRAADGAADAPVQWRVAGAVQPGSRAPFVVDLGVDSTLTLECQRCLQPVTVPLSVERRLRFVEGEDEAARLDEELEDDVLALTHRLDLRALVEDELLLALPLVPRHDTCPQLPDALRPAVAPPADEDSAAPAPEHPFAALAAWRRTKP
ncbi:MAG: DUF177 domain-containing protein [Rubrivivax sp.]|nr:DUF177 domain-containing protein [Rubrivivax sp.]